MSARNVSVSVAAASRRLCLLATVKSDLGITDSSEDTKLDRLIVAASLTLAGPEGLNREPWFQTYVENMAGADGVYLYPTHWPIHEVSSVTWGTGASPSTVDASTYSIRGDNRAIYRATEWVRTGWDSQPRLTGARSLDYNVTYEAGWVMPDLASAWAASTAYSLGDWVSSTDDDEPFIFQCTTAGTSDATEPTWPTVARGTVTDNSAVWTAYDQRLPQDVEEAAILTVMEWHTGGLEAPAGIASESAESFRVVYRDGFSGALSVPPAAQALCRPYRELMAA